MSVVKYDTPKMTPDEVLEVCYNLETEAMIKRFNEVISKYDTHIADLQKQVGYWKKSFHKQIEMNRKGSK